MDHFTAAMPRSHDHIAASMTEASSDDIRARGVRDPGPSARAVARGEPGHPGGAEMTPADATAKSVEIYTDGACIGNPGRGGYGAVILGDGERRELSAGFRLTTNNRMELLGAIEALAALATRSAVTLHSDSSYVVRGMTEGWARKWQAKNWYRTKTQRAVNPDLWQRLLELAEKHNVTFRWVPGHAGVRENERCDRLAVAAASDTNLAPDIVYEASLVRDKPAPTQSSLF